MESKWLWLTIVFAVVLSFGFVLACGDDDDDDDDDDDLGGAGYDECVLAVMDCFDLPEATSEDLCDEHYEVEQQCGPGATDRLIDCVGNDCSKWDDCADEWTDEVNC